MSYVSTTDPKFLSTLEQWFENQNELLALIRYSHAAGNREYEFFSSAPALADRIRHLIPRTSIIVWKEPQLLLRGVVDDNFVASCLRTIPEGSEYLVVETIKRVYGRLSWFHYGAAESHTELREDLEESRGKPVAAGLHPKKWWVDSDDVISAVVPDESGVAKLGVY